MPALIPRRTFAAPLVITLAALPGCGAQGGEPPPVAPLPTGPILNPPRPPENPPPPPPEARRWSVSRSGDTCTSFFRGSTCAPFVPGHPGPGPTCNPPPPFKYPCPPGLANGDWTVVQSATSATGHACEVEQAAPPLSVPCPP